MCGHEEIYLEDLCIRRLQTKPNMRLLTFPNTHIAINTIFVRHNSKRIREGPENANAVSTSRDLCLPDYRRNTGVDDQSRHRVSFLCSLRADSKAEVNLF